MNKKLTMLEKLRIAQEKSKSKVIVGLDFNLKKISEEFAERYNDSPLDCIVEFNKETITEVLPYVCGFKPNLAFYESYGALGLVALKKVIQEIRKQDPEKFIILDGKRGDIGNTANHYAIALRKLGADAVTVNPYLGPKTLMPFVNAGLGIFALCVTSNPDAAIFQNIPVTGIDGQVKDSNFLYVAEVLAKGIISNEEELIIRESHSFNPPDNWKGQLGLVTGATHPKELAKVRKLVGNDVVLLIPGIGKQGGDLLKTLTSNGKDGMAVINSSSAVIFSEDPAAAAKKLRDDINKIIDQL